MSELANEAINLFLQKDYYFHKLGTITNIDRALSELESLKRDVEKIKQFLARKFGMEVYTLRT
jgi:hypothetical protein